MFNLKFGVTYTDGRKVEVQVRPIDTMLFEEHYDIATTEAFRTGGEPKLTHVYFLAWSATDTTLELKEWLRSVAEIDVDARDAVPFVRANPDGP